MVDTSEDVSAEAQEEIKEVTQQVASPIGDLEAKIVKLTKDLDNARKGEKFAKSTKEELSARITELEAQGEWKSKYEQAEEKLKNFTLDTVISDAAKAARAKDTKAILKLVDRSTIVYNNGVVDTKSVEAAISATKKEFGLLFEAVELPPGGRAAEGDVTSGYQKEIRAAKSIKDIEAVMAKYNMK
jgi:outer membrane murein-binding lipoprotein Lpp